MVNYNNGKIYKIEDLGGEMCYIGSTTKDYLSKRMVEHRNKYKRWQTVVGATNFSVFNIFEKYGLEGCRIVLVELCPCDSKDELLKREAYYITLLECVNKNHPIRPQGYKKEYKLDYNINNKIAIQTQVKKYYTENKEYFQAISALKNTCVCGNTYRQYEKNRHEKTAKHINYIANQTMDI